MAPLILIKWFSRPLLKGVVHFIRANQSVPCQELMAPRDLEWLQLSDEEFFSIVDGNVDC